MIKSRTQSLLIISSSAFYISIYSSIPAIYIVTMAN